MKQKIRQSSDKMPFSSKNYQSYAPFGSVSPRNKKKKRIQPMEQLGPGAYDISLPIIKPIIQTIKKKNNNIIVKLSHIGTSSFQGQKQRFYNEFINKNTCSEQIGPGKYSPQKSSGILETLTTDKNTDRFKLPKRKQAGIQLAKYIKNRQRKAATFSEVKRIQIEEYFEMPSLQDRDTQKNKDPHLNNKNKIKGLAWSMMKEQRLKATKNTHHNIGPGHYYVSDLQDKKEKNLRSISEKYHSSYFRSQSIRSHFDNILFQTNQQKKALMREASGYKSDSIGPGAYQVSERRQKQNKFQFFGSTEQRKLI